MGRDTVEHPSDADVLIDIGPVDTDAVADDFVAGTLIGVDVRRFVAVKAEEE